MRLILAGLIFISVLAPTFAKADTSWNRLFDGDESGLRDDWSYNDFDKWEATGKTPPFLKWIRGYSQCQKEADALWGTIAEYDKKFRDGDSKAAEAVYDQILKALSNSPRGDCQGVLQRIYFVGVVNMGPSYSGQDIFYRNDLVILTTLLANKDVINFLTPELRSTLAAGKKSLWTEQKNGDYLLSGIYRCQKSQIYLSSSLRPFNLAASLAHEIDHLYRDKSGYQYMWDWINNRDVRSFVVSDEILASMYGALYQRNLYLMDKQSGSTVDYTTQGDEFNLFQRNGPLSKLMDFTHLSPPVPFFEFYGLIEQKKNDPWVKKTLCEIDKMIRTGYFETNNGQCNLKGVFPDTTWFTTESYISSLEDMRRDPARFTEYMTELQTMADTIAGVSPICSAMVDSEDHGDLKDYIGSQLEDSGGHTGNSGVKPCLRVKY